MLKVLQCRLVYSSFFTFSWDTSEMSYPDSNQLQKFFRKKMGKKIVFIQREYIYSMCIHIYMPLRRKQEQKQKPIEIMAHLYPVIAETFKKKSKEVTTKSFTDFAVVKSFPR